MGATGRCHSDLIADEVGLRPILAADDPGAVEARLDPRVLLDALPDIVVVADRDMHIVLANRAAEEFFGLPVAGRALTDLMPERQRAAHIAGFTRFVSSGAGRYVGGPPMRVTALAKGETEVEVEVHLGALGRHDDPDVLLLGCLRDVGDRVALEHEAITASYIRAVLDAAYELQRAPDGESLLREVLPALCTRLQWDFAAVWLVDRVDEVLRCASTWQAPDTQLEGFAAVTRDTTLRRGIGLVGSAWAREETVVVDDLSAKRDWPQAGAAREAGLRAAVAFPLVGRRRVLGVVELLSRQMPPTTPEVADLLTTVGRQAGAFMDRLRDEERTRRSEQELRYRAALLTAQIDSAPQAVLAVSRERRVIASNQRFEELWGLPPGSVVVGGPSPALLPETLAQVRDPAAFAAAVRWGHEHPTEPQRLEVPLVDGRVIEGHAAPIVDETGGYHGRIWFLTDDTDRRRVEHERTELLGRLQEAQRSQGFLLDAARILARAWGYAETLERLAAVAVPTLGDICLIDVVDADGSVRRMAARHAEPSRQGLVDELRHYAPEPGSTHPSVDVARSRQSRWSADMSDEFLRATCRDEAHFAIVKELGFTSYMSVPLSTERETLGALTVVSAGSGRRFGPGDLALAEALADQVAQVVAKAHRYEQEHRVAHTLQANLLPPRIPEVPGVDLALRYAARPREADVGGDWYDVQLLPSGEVRVAVGDVAGHDVGAAAAMGQLRSACRALTTHAASPVELVQELRAGWDHLDVDRMATLVVAQLSPDTGALQIASAGHPPPLLVSRRQADYLGVRPGPPLGAPDAPTTQWRGALARDAVLLLYTDGLIENGRNRLDEAMRHLAASAAGITAPETLCERVLASMPGEANDDIALLAMARHTA